MYYDKHEYDLFSYFSDKGSAACGIAQVFMEPGIFDSNNDAVVWCIEDLPP
jgi:hypothetical protein